MKKFIWQDVIKMNIFVLRLFGMWSTNDTLIKTDPYTYLTMFVIFCSATHILCQTINIPATFSDIELFTLTALCCFCEILSLFKIITFLTNGKMLKRLLLDLKDDIFQPRNSQQILMIMPDIQIWTMIYRTIMTAAGFCAFLFSLVPVLSGTVKDFVLPFSAWYPYDTEKPLTYIATYLHQTIGICLITFSVYNIDMLITALMLYIGAQCDLLCDNLRNMDDFEKMLKESVVHHMMILTFAENCNKFFDFILLGQFLISAIGLALALFRLTMVTTSSFQFYTLLCGVISFTMQLFTYCWFSNKTQTKSEQIIYALFESSWTNQCLSAKKNMMIFVERAQFPIKLSTFKLFYLTLETFVKILRSAVSYYTVLQQLSGFK